MASFKSAFLKPYYRILARLCPDLQVWTKLGPYTLPINISAVYQRFMLSGEYDAEFFEFIVPRLSPEDTIFDVGAEIGYFSMRLGAQLGSRGHLFLFEPDPRRIAALQANLGSDQRSSKPRTHIIQAACSERSGSAMLELAQTSGQSTLQIDVMPATPPPHIEVRTLPLDEFIASEQITNIRLLKLDVEGWEIFCLRGLRQTLEARCIEYFFVEKHKGLLHKNGFTPYHLHSIFTIHGYEALQPNGCPYDEANLARIELENILYRRLPVSSPSPSAITCHDFYAYFIDPDYPHSSVAHTWQLINAGELYKAIQLGESLLVAEHKMLWFRGHVASWCHAAGDSSRALHHYNILHTAHPHDSHVRDQITRLTAV